MAETYKDGWKFRAEDSSLGALPQCQLQVHDDGADCQEQGPKHDTSSEPLFPMYYHFAFLLRAASLA